MGTILAEDLIVKAGDVLHDETGIRWDARKLLDYLNDGQREIVVPKPDAYTQTEVVELVSGVNQAVSGRTLLDITRNMGTDGNTPGRAITRVDRNTLDRHSPGWASGAPEDEIQHFFYDDRNPAWFGVYPPSSGNGHVEKIYSEIPPDTTFGKPISVSDIYSNALLNFMLYRAYQKDTQHSPNAEKAAAYYQLFMSSLGYMDRRELADSPNAQRGQ